MQRNVIYIRLFNVDFVQATAVIKKLYRSDEVTINPESYGDYVDVAVDRCDIVEVCNNITSSIDGCTAIAYLATASQKIFYGSLWGAEKRLKIQFLVDKKNRHKNKTAVDVLLSDSDTNRVWISDYFTDKELAQIKRAIEYGAC